MLLLLKVTTALLCLTMSLFAATGTDSSMGAKKPGLTKSPAPAPTVSSDKKGAAKTPAASQAAPAAEAKPLLDTLVITARLIEIPGTFAPNDLYNYVYIMKYRVINVVKGKYPVQEILVGHYNPLIPRKQINDKMMRFVSGDATRFKTGDIHKLVLIKPIERVWKDAVEDDYFDSDLDKYYALRVDNAK